jgi:hypothetical protein
MPAFERPEYTPVNHGRWRWLLAALAPGLFSVVLFAAYMLAWLVLPEATRSGAAAGVGPVVLCAAMLLPFSIPLYLYLVGRRYVRVVHDGHKPVLPFVLMYSVANVLLWGAGALMLAGNMGWR